MTNDIPFTTYRYSFSFYTSTKFYCFVTEHTGISNCPRLLRSSDTDGNWNRDRQFTSLMPYHCTTTTSAPNCPCSHDRIALQKYMLIIIIIIIIIILSGKTPWWLKNYKKMMKSVWQWTLLWPVIISKAIMQQNRVKSLHHNRDLLEQKRRSSNIPGRLHQSPAQLAQELKSISVDWAMRLHRIVIINICDSKIMPEAPSSVDQCSHGTEQVSLPLIRHLPGRQDASVSDRSLHERWHQPSVPAAVPPCLSVLLVLPDAEEWNHSAQQYCVSQSFKNVNLSLRNHKKECTYGNIFIYVRQFQYHFCHTVSYRINVLSFFQFGVCMLF